MRKFFRRFRQEKAFTLASEVRILKRMGRDIRAQLPPDPVRQLRRELRLALRAERYEEAARLRDEIDRLEARE